MNASILVIEDDFNIQELIVEFLGSQGYNVDFSSDGLEGISKFKQGNYDLIILDIMMPNLDGYSVCKMIRKNSKIPIIFLSALNEEENQLKGFELECDDYITKPFSPSELMARVDGLYRRVEMLQKKTQKSEDEIVLGEFTLNLRRRSLYKNGRNTELTQVEFQIVEYFFTNPNVTLDRTDILNRVWGENYFGEEKIVDVNIRRLRMKIEDDPSHPKHLITVWGMGYKWATD